MWVLLRLKSRNCDRGILQNRSVRCSRRQGMLKPAGIVPLRKVRTIVGPTAFRPGECTGDDGFGDIKEGLELKGLHEFRIKHEPFILHGHGGGALGQCPQG